MAKTFDPTLELKYNKFYIGLSKDGQAYNFMVSRPRKSTLNLELKIPRTDEIDKKIEDAGLETLDYATRWGAYRLTLKKEDLSGHKDLLTELIGAAHSNRGA